MNWKLIFGLSMFGLAMAFATVYFIPAGLAESLCWLPIFIICAIIIAKRAPGKYFLHGFFTSLVNCVWITGVHVALSQQYFAHHADEATQMAKMNSEMHISPTIAMLIFGPIIGIISGVVLGLFALIAAKALGIKKPYYTT